jgi:hypothetical protein
MRLRRLLAKLTRRRCGVANEPGDLCTLPAYHGGLHECWNTRGVLVDAWALPHHVRQYPVPR